ncbi:type II toxin-antitoxin system VapC family toxin [Candidatus Thiodictyon syntrophicum]|jgi:PIN domain nuclease of toxin-antitoxin system|uniref:Twitching motility protein PilT n=1 Tax=Candidatus Thiodictyon syntrophicum TaxID=1166950 RepID=A0A2K8U604_9GAMM|nr:type II toxin-antitoxin system VapC family toxin [Candidatus Thiodictyon syntrophicum]AUB80985.1 twitching motility protein PilT [Candidatus Thiodictyon syntrophicum]
MVVLDTHIWLWWINREQARLKPAWTARIDSAEQVGVSAISCFEVAWLNHHGRIELPGPLHDWFEKALDGSGIALLPITPEIARVAVELPEHHRDPQDRLIIATAIARDAMLISVDEKFLLYSELAGHLMQ